MISKRIKIFYCPAIFVFILITLYVYSHLEFSPKTEWLIPRWVDGDHFCETLIHRNSTKWGDWNYKAIRLVSSKLSLDSDDQCQDFQKIKGFKVQSNSEELEFPLAYAINSYDNANQMARLLRLIYRPHNLYCIHVDAKATLQLWNSIKRLAECFGPNVILVDFAERINVKWGYYSVLESVLKCAKYMLENPRINWRYMLNANEKEMPLKTNWELVRAIRALNGSNMVEVQNGSGFPERHPNKNVTFKINWIKGSFLAVLRREFVQFMLTDLKALEILDVLKSEQHLPKIPDELYFSTLNFNYHLGAPGACDLTNHKSSDDKETHYYGRFVKWDLTECSGGLIRHGICILGIQDLAKLIKAPELFANKFIAHHEPLSYDCLENWVMNKMIREWKTQTLDPLFSDKPYSDLYCSRYHLGP